MDLDTKAAFRKRLRAERDALSDAERAQLGASIVHHLLMLPWLSGTSPSAPPLKPPTCVALYATFGSEPPTEDLFHALTQRSIRCCFPRTQPGKSLDFIHVTDLAQLAPGTYGIREPQGEKVPLAEVDLVVMPGVAFDRHGARLGYGVGYYDRALAHYNGICVGTAFARQLVGTLPAEVHDRSLDVIVTEHEVIATSARARTVLAQAGLPHTPGSTP